MRRPMICRSGAPEGGICLFSVPPAARESIIFTTHGHPALKREHDKCVNCGCSPFSHLTVTLRSGVNRTNVCKWWTHPLFLFHILFLVHGHPAPGLSAVRMPAGQCGLSVCGVVKCEPRLRSVVPIASCKRI
eukprot:365819-Chlamydomonas_euryale.AAC.7